MAFEYNFSFSMTTMQTRVLKHVLADWVLVDQIPNNGYWHSISHKFSLVLQDAIGRYTNHITPFIKVPDDEHVIENPDINSLALASVCETIRKKLYETDNAKFRELRKAGQINTTDLIKQA